jgi:hypothetical protein
LPAPPRRAIHIEMQNDGSCRYGKRPLQSLTPIAACGVFLGLGAITVTMLRAEGLTLGFVGPLRALLLGAVWSIVLAWKIAGLATANYLRRFTATVCVALAVSTGAASWVVFFWVWQ